MKSANFIFVFIITTNVFSQEIQFSTERLKYFEYVNEAELAICRGSYKNAICFYDSAMHLVDNPSNHDLYNLALCHKNTGNSKQADSLFGLLLSKGYGKKHIGSCYDTIKNIISKKNPIIINGKDLNNILVEIFREDQRANSVRAKSMEAYTQIIINNAKKIMSLAQEVDDLLLQDVEGYLLYPIYHFLQTKGISESVKSDSTFKKRWYVYSFLENVDFDEIKFYEFLKEQVAKGNFDRYALISHISGDGYNFGMPINQFNEYIVVKSPEVICKDELILINNIRKSFGLEPYKDFYKKARFRDSLLTSGKPFTAIALERYGEMLDELDSMCNFQIVKNYRTMMGFDSSDDAKKVYERNIKELCGKKEDNP